jgi:hypothetical protein
MKTFYPLFLIPFFALITLSACKKKDFQNGKDAMDPNEILNGITTDTFDIITYTIAEDSTITSNPVNVILGSYNDPKFGQVTASFYTQVRLAGLNPNVGDPNTIAIDSFVLAMSYVGYYGDFSPQTFEVYELNEDLSIDSTYYSFTTKSTKSQNLVVNGMGTITPSPTTNSVVGSDTVNPQLRIPLDTNLARVLINEAGSNSATFSSDDAFQSYFKGIKVKTNNPAQASGSGAILYFDLNNSASKITIYFRQDGLSKTLDFFINKSCADFTHVDIQNAGKPIQNVLQDSTKGNVEFYAQAFKHRAIVQIPGLNNLSDKIVVHRADLTLPIQYQTGYRYRPGFSVSAATKLKITDRSYTSLGILGDLDDGKKHFKLNLKNYIQAIANKNIENNGIVISPRFFINSAERIVFNGKNTSNKNRPKLILTYTTY